MRARVCVCVCVIVVGGPQVGGEMRRVGYVTLAAILTTASERMIPPPFLAYPRQDSIFPSSGIILTESYPDREASVDSAKILVWIRSEECFTD